MRYAEGRRNGVTNEDAIKWLDNLKNDLGNPHYECLWPYAQALDEICEMLEAHEPERAEIVDRDGGRTHWYVCGGCKTPINKGDRFCYECGRAVKWDE